MTSENACYQFLLLKHGFYDQYNKWFDTLLEEENPLSAETLGLIDCNNDYEKITAYLANIAIDGYDRAAVCEKIRLFLRDEYFSGRITRPTCVNVMKTASEFAGFWEKPSWHRMNLVAGFCAIHDWLTEEQTETEFEKALKQYLETGLSDYYSV